jgi:hypothetical protein
MNLVKLINESKVGKTKEVALANAIKVNRLGQIYLGKEDTSYWVDEIEPKKYRVASDFDLVKGTFKTAKLAVANALKINKYDEIVINNNTTGVWIQQLDKGFSLVSDYGTV